MIGLYASLFAFALTAMAPTAILAQSTNESKMAAALSIAPAFGGPFHCNVSTLKNSNSVFVAANSDPLFKLDPKSLNWALEGMKRIGYQSTIPADAKSRAAALLNSTLLMRGNLVAAKMGNDEASAKIDAYKRSAFASNFEALLTVFTQPVAHASYPSSVRAEGEKEPDATVKHPGTHGVDLEQSSVSLLEVIRRAQVAKKVLGATYDLPAVRYYLLAQGFGDIIGLHAASANVCALGLNKSIIDKINVSARYMAMPSKAEANKADSGSKQ